TAVETPTPTPPTIFEAPVTGESDTNLSNYTPQTGDGFSIETLQFGTPDPQEPFAFAATDTASTESGGAQGSAGTMAIADPGPSSANYYVEIDVITERDGGDDPLIRILQWQDEDNWYGARIYDDSCQIFKVVNGSAAQLDSAN